MGICSAESSKRQEYGDIPDFEYRNRPRRGIILIIRYKQTAQSMFKNFLSAFQHILDHLPGLSWTLTITVTKSQNSLQTAQDAENKSTSANAHADAPRGPGSAHKATATANTIGRPRPPALGPPREYPCPPNRPSPPPGLLCSAPLSGSTPSIAVSLPKSRRRQCESCSCHISLTCEQVQAGRQCGAKIERGCRRVGMKAMSGRTRDDERSSRGRRQLARALPSPRPCTPA